MTLLRKSPANAMQAKKEIYYGGNTYLLSEKTVIFQTFYKRGHGAFHRYRVNR